MIIPLKERGFTLVEILVISPIMMVTIIFLMSFLFSQYGQLTQQGALINLQVENQNITFSMQDDVFFARSFESDKNANLTDAYAPSGGWTYNTTPQTLILSTPALTANRRSANRTPVYINTEGCSPIDVLQSNSELYNNVIYYVSGTNLYKRVLSAPSTMTTCGTSFMKQTCPQAQSSTACPPDRQLTDKLNSFTVTYYDTSNTVVATPEQAERITVTIQLKDKAFAEDIFSTNSITLRKLNQ
jgi:competence protein ComGC